MSKQTVQCRIYKEKQERISLAGWAWHDANDLSTSPWFGSSGTLVILCYRCFLLAIFFLVVILEATQGTATSDWATFFTNWTFVAFLIHSIVGIAQSIRGIRRGARRPEAEGWTWQSFDWLDKLHSIIATSVITITLHVAIFYWSALYDGSVCTYIGRILKDDLCLWMCTSFVCSLCVAPCSMCMQCVLEVLHDLQHNPSMMCRLRQMVSSNMLSMLPCCKLNYGSAAFLGQFHGWCFQLHTSLFMPSTCGSGMLRKTHGSMTR